MPPKRNRLACKKGWRLQDGAKSVAYPTRRQNPYRHVRPRGEYIRFFRGHLDRRPELVSAARLELKGYDLACWCPLGEPCHADVWLEILNSTGGD